MRMFNIEDRVIIVKEADRNYGKHGVIYCATELSNAPVTIYDIKFDDGSKGYYFFSEIMKEI